MGGMTSRPDRVPFRPDPSAVRNCNPRDTLYRAAAASFVGHVLRRDPLELTKDDAAANLVLRAAKTPAIIGTGGWANQLAATDYRLLLQRGSSDRSTKR